MQALVYILNRKERDSLGIMRYLDLHAIPLTLFVLQYALCDVLRTH